MSGSSCARMSGAAAFITNTLIRIIITSFVSVAAGRKMSSTVTRGVWKTKCARIPARSQRSIRTHSNFSGIVKSACQLESMLEVLIASFLVMLVSLSGKLVAWRGLGALIERNLHFFVSFAAGVLLLVAWSLSQELVEHAGSLSAGLPWIALGAVVILVVFRYIPQFHHHHDKNDHPHSRIDANRVFASDA